MALLEIDGRLVPPEEIGGGEVVEGVGRPVVVVGELRDYLLPVSREATDDLVQIGRGYVGRSTVLRATRFDTTE